MSVMARTTIHQLNNIITEVCRIAANNILPQHLVIFSFSCCCISMHITSSPRDASRLWTLVYSCNVAVSCLVPNLVGVTPSSHHG